VTLDIVVGEFRVSCADDRQVRHSEMSVISGWMCLSLSRVHPGAYLGGLHLPLPLSADINFWWCFCHFTIFFLPEHQKLGIHYQNASACGHNVHRPHTRALFLDPTWGLLSSDPPRTSKYAPGVHWWWRGCQWLWLLTSVVTACHCLHHFSFIVFSRPY